MRLPLSLPDMIRVTMHWNLMAIEAQLTLAARIWGAWGAAAASRGMVKAPPAAQAAPAAAPAGETTATARPARRRRATLPATA